MQFILFIALIYLFFRLLIRYVLPWFLASRINKMQNRQHQTVQDLINKKKKEEGKVSVDYIPNKKKSSISNGGEYVDYEEID